MINSVYIPDLLNENDKLPCLIYLSGLTCTDENVMQKGGAFKKLFEHKIGLQQFILFTIYLFIYYFRFN
jgi:hypothetical protein